MGADSLKHRQRLRNVTSIPALHFHDSIAVRALLLISIFESSQSNFSTLLVFATSAIDMQGILGGGRWPEHDFDERGESCTRGGRRGR